MQIKVKILTEPIEPTNHRMICVPKSKYSDVDLALKMDNGNVVFASIEMHDGTYSDKSQQFEALSEFGEKIAECWNEKYFPNKGSE